MADFCPPFTPSPRRVSLLGLGLPSPSSAENSPPAALRPTPSPRLRREQRKALFPLADESDDGCSPHPSIYEASPVASDDECQGDKEPLSVCFETTKPQTADLLSPNPDGTNSPPSGRDISRFPGLSLLETIAEQKSASTEPEERNQGSYIQLPTEDDGSEDDGSEDEEFEQYYYEYASPTQPLHPALSTSAPQHTGQRALIYPLFIQSGGSKILTLANRIAIPITFPKSSHRYISSCEQFFFYPWFTTVPSPIPPPTEFPPPGVHESFLWDSLLASIPSRSCTYHLPR